MLSTLARLVIHRRRLVLLIALLLAPLAAIFGGGVLGSLQPGGYDDPGSEASRVQRQLRSQLGSGDADIVALYTVPKGTVDDPAVRDAVSAALGRAARDPAVMRILSYYDLAAPQLVNTSRSRTFAVLSLRGDDQAKLAALDQLRPLLRANGARLQLGGISPVFKALNQTVEQDLRRAELVAFPVVAVLAVLVFGSVVSAGVPLVLGALALLFALLALRLVAAVTDISVFALNLVILLGLGLTVDYALFIVNRYREELPLHDPDEALVIAMRTTGRAIAFSGVTLAAGLTGLLVFPQLFLRSMAIGGIAVTLVAVLLSWTVLPALLAVLGPRLDAGRLPWLGHAGGTSGREQGFWRSLALTVMRRPVLVVVATTAFLLLLGVPFLRLRGSIPDARMLGPSVEARQVNDILDAEFYPRQTTPHDIVLTAQSPILTSENVDSVGDYIRGVAGLSGVARIDSLFSSVPNVGLTLFKTAVLAPPEQLSHQTAARLDVFVRGNTTHLLVIPNHAIDSAQTQRQVTALRALPPPPGMTAHVGGRAARLHDIKRSLHDRIPLALIVVGAAMFLVLFLAFGSVLLPLKAIVMTLLSLGASYGAMVWVFQDGRLQGLFRYHATGTVDVAQPILLFAVVFGLSMDYEILLLSRVREEYDRTGDNTEAVARGLAHTGCLITSAAALLVVVIAALTTSSLVSVKELGLGMALAITLDATVVRALLVPATMKLLGRWNWWAPKPLSRLRRKVVAEHQAAPLPMPSRVASVVESARPS